MTWPLESLTSQIPLKELYFYVVNDFNPIEWKVEYILYVYFIIRFILVDAINTYPNKYIGKRERLEMYKSENNNVE